MLFPDAPALEHLADLRIAFNPAHDVGAAPHGRRAVAIIASGTVAGPSLRGQVRQGGGDWSLRHAGGAREIDLRATLEFDDGALVYIACAGMAEYGGGALRAIARFEAGDERYAWLNGVVCAGAGRLDADAIAMRLFVVR